MIICGDQVHKSWTYNHFDRESHTYDVPLDSLTLKEVSMKEDLRAFWDILCYE